MKSRALPWLPPAATLALSIPRSYSHIHVGSRGPIPPCNRAQPPITHPAHPFHATSDAACPPGQVSQIRHSCAVAGSPPRRPTAPRMHLVQTPERGAHIAAQGKTLFARGLTQSGFSGRHARNRASIPIEDQTGGSSVSQPSGLWVG